MKETNEPKELAETQLVHEFPKNLREKVRVEFMNYRGTDVQNLWMYYSTDNGKEEWRPSKKGLSISTDLIPELKRLRTGTTGSRTGRKAGGYGLEVGIPFLLG